MDYQSRIKRFQNLIGEQADLAFIPISADLQYLVGVPRDDPNFGATLHPGAWAEGAWLSPKHDPILVLPRMSAEFGGLSRMEGVEVRVFGDWDDPYQVVKGIFDSFGVSSKVRIAIGERALAETVAAIHRITPEAHFINHPGSPLHQRDRHPARATGGQKRG